LVIPHFEIGGGARDGGDHRGTTAAKRLRVRRAFKAWLPVLLEGLRATIGAAVVASGGSISVALARLAVGSGISLVFAISRRLADGV
jgi:hypothetical protein